MVLVRNGSCRALLVKSNLLFFQYGPSRLIPTSPVRRSSPLRLKVFNSHQRSASYRLNSSPTPLSHWSMSEIRIPEFLDFINSTKLPKVVRRSNIAPSAKQRQIIVSAIVIDGIVLMFTMTPQPGFGCIIPLRSNSEPQPPIYHVTVSSYPKCNCANFLDMVSKFGRKCNSNMNYKYLYYIFIKVSNLDAEVNLFIHVPTFSFNEVKFILEGGLLIQPTS